MKRLATVILAIICCTIAYAQQKKDSPINYGVKSGFSSTIYYIKSLQINASPINDYTTKSEISSFFAGFARFNLKKHYIQTDISYNISNYSISFLTKQWNSTASETELSIISTKINGIEIPLYYGYHIMKSGPYGMSFYVGPKAEFVIADHSNHTFENFPYKDIKEKIYPCNFSMMMGLDISITPVFFDFSFEYGLHNISQGINSPSTDIAGIIFNRRKNVLSFSIGFIL